MQRRYSRPSLLVGFAVALLLSAAARHATATMVWRNCAEPVDEPLLDPNNVTMSPDPPHHGQAMTVTVTGSTRGGVPIDAKMRASVYFHGWHVHSVSKDLCTALQCPLPAGPFTLVDASKLPSLAPAGSYSLQLESIAGNKRFMCVYMDFTMTAPSPKGKRDDADESTLELLAGAAETTADRAAAVTELFIKSVAAKAVVAVDELQHTKEMLGGVVEDGVSNIHAARAGQLLHLRGRIGGKNAAAS